MSQRSPGWNWRAYPSMPSAGATVPPTRRHQAQALEAQLGSTPAQSRNGAAEPSFRWLRTGKAHNKCSTLCSTVGMPSPTRTRRPSPPGGADPLIPVLLDYREAEKRAGTYGLAWLDKASTLSPAACTRTTCNSAHGLAA